MVPGTTGNADKDWQTFGDAYDSVVNKLPTWAQQAHPDWMVLRSMADSLKDGHTSFMTPDEARRRNETSFAGIGVLMSRPQDNQPPLIAEIFPSSPASTSGLKRGDRIIGVDGQDVARPYRERTHGRVLDLPATGQLFDHELGVEACLDRGVRIYLPGRGEPGDQSAVLRNVVGLGADVLGALGEHLPGLRVTYDCPIGRGTRIASGSAIGLDDEARHALETGL